MAEASPQRLLLGPGPSMVHPRVMRAMGEPLVGHLDPNFLTILSEIAELLRDVFQTENSLTLAVSGTGTSGMETALSNLIEPGDRILACVNGYFGDRMAEMASRYGAEVRQLERPWGEVFDPNEIDEALVGSPTKVVTLIHAETSSGTLQPEITAIAEICRRHGALLVLDCVTSLAGLPVEVDSWDVDIAYGATQKCLSAPPGLAPITVGQRARAAIAERSGPPPVFYLDLGLIERYWGKEHAYHHTAPISGFYALKEALLLVREEGLGDRFARHRANAHRLWEGLEALGIRFHVPSAIRLPTLTTVTVPDGVDDVSVRRRLLEEHNIEIGAGFGPLAGQIWRIGLMGHSSQTENIDRLLSALKELLPTGADPG
ncbi:MAG: pyridoxal-phosphate-dependent aminotransferase family protein [Anaerolineae bacterium]